MKHSFKHWLIRNTLPSTHYMSFDESGGEGAPPSKGDDTKLTTYTDAEVSQRVEAARRDEKAKLYEELNGLRKNKDSLSTDFESSKTQVQTLTDDCEKATKALAELQSQHDALVAAQKENGSVDTEKLIKEITQSIRKEYEDTQGKTTLQLQKELSDLREAKRHSDLAAYRTEKIQAAGGTLISELVRGNSEDEIDRSVTEAQEAYKKYIKANAGNEGNADGSPPPPPPNSPSGGSRTPTSSQLDGFTRPNSREDYAKNRSKVLDDVRKRFSTT